MSESMKPSSADFEQWTLLSDACAKAIERWTRGDHEARIEVMQLSAALKSMCPEQEAPANIDAASAAARFQS